MTDNIYRVYIFKVLPFFKKIITQKIPKTYPKNTKKIPKNTQKYQKNTPKIPHTKILVLKFTNKY